MAPNKNPELDRETISRLHHQRRVLLGVHLRLARFLSHQIYNVTLVRQLDERYISRSYPGPTNIVRGRSQMGTASNFSIYVFESSS